MSQLITTTDISTIRPVFSQGASENIKRYNQLKKFFEQGKEYQVFAEPIPAGGQKIAWHTDFEGTAIPFAKLSQQEQETVKGRLKFQVNKLYQTVIQIVKSSGNNVNELFELLDSCIEIPNYNDIYVFQSSTGQKNFCIIRWGFTSDDFQAQSGLIERLIPIKVNSVPIKAVFSNDKIAPDQKISIEYLSYKSTSQTDLDGKIYLEDIPFFTKISAFQINPNTNEKIHEHSYVCDERDEFIFRIGVPNQDITFNIVDTSGRPIKNAPIFFEYQGNKIKKYTDDFGNIALQEIPIGTDINCIQNENFNKKFSCETGVTQYKMVGETPKTNMLFKVVDENGVPIPNALISFAFEGNQIERNSDSNGFILLENIVIGDKVNCEQILDGVNINKQNFICEKEKAEYLIGATKPILTGMMNIKLVDENKKALAENELKIEYNNQSVKLKTDEKGFVRLTDIPFGTNVKCSQMVDGVAKHQHIFVVEQDKTEYTMLGSLSKPIAKYSNIQVLVVNRKNEPIRNLKVTLTSGYNTTNQYTDDDGRTIFSAVNCTNELKLFVEHKNQKKEKKFFCKEDTELHKFVLGKKRFMWLLWLLLLLLLLALLFWFFILPKININNIVIVDTVQVVDTTHVMDTIPKAEPGMKVIVIDKKTNQPLSNAVVEITYQGKVLSGSTDLKGVVKFKEIPENDTIKITAKINATGFTEQLAQFNFVKEKIFYMSDESIDISEIIYPCGELIESKGYGSTIKTFDIKKTSGTLRIIFDMFSIPDKLIVYQGKASEISDDKIIWQTPNFVKGLHKESFSFNAPDGLVTVQIKGGDEEKTEWYFRVYCP
jgi:hypothetical protein